MKRAHHVLIQVRPLMTFQAHVLRWKPEKELCLRSVFVDERRDLFRERQGLFDVGVIEDDKLFGGEVTHGVNYNLTYFFSRLHLGLHDLQEISRQAHPPAMDRHSHTWLWQPFGFAGFGVDDRF